MSAGRWRLAWRNPSGTEHRSRWESTEEDVRSVVADMNRRWPDTLHWAESVPEEAPVALAPDDNADSP